MSTPQLYTISTKGDVLPSAARLSVWSALPQDKQLALLRQRSAPLRQRSLLGYALLCQALQLPYTTLSTLQYTPKGKPFFPQENLPHFSLSHTDGLVVCAVHTHPVGVDVEGFTPTTQEEMTQWTAMESRVKCSGQGLGDIIEPYPLWTGILYDHFVVSLSTEAPIKMPVIHQWKGLNTHDEVHNTPHPSAISDVAVHPDWG